MRKNSKQPSKTWKIKRSENKNPNKEKVLKKIRYFEKAQIKSQIPILKN